MTTESYFSKETFAFLNDLAVSNNRQWFARNKARYETAVKEPALRFIMGFAPLLDTVSTEFRADPRPVGGSLFRIYRDTRFSKDKSPYKTHAGIQFRHKMGRDAHAPSYYLHLEPRNVFAAVGIWHPDSGALKRIRDHIVRNPSGWRRAVSAKRFAHRFELAGDALQRAPRGYDSEHELIDDIKRKDFVAVAGLTQSAVTRRDFPREFARICRDGSPLVKFLCEALGVPF